MWEKLNLNDAVGLYNAACYRAVTAGVLRADTGRPTPANRPTPRPTSP